VIIEVLSLQPKAMMWQEVSTYLSMDSHSPCNPLTPLHSVPLPHSLLTILLFPPFSFSPHTRPLPRTILPYFSSLSHLHVLVSRGKHKRFHPSPFTLPQYLPKLFSLHEYVLIAQDQARIESYLRQPNGEWLFATVLGWRLCST